MEGIMYGGRVVIIKARKRGPLPLTPHLQPVLLTRHFPRSLWTSMGKKHGEEQRGKDRVAGSSAGYQQQVEKLRTAKAVAVRRKKFMQLSD